jgi:hypothetical protein
MRPPSQGVVYGSAVSSTLLCVARLLRLLVYMALVRHSGDLAASRSSGTGHGAALREKLGAPVRTYWPDPSTIPEALSVSDDQTDKVAITIAGSRHSQPVGCQRQKTPADQLERSPIQIYCCRGKLPDRAGSAVTTRVFASRCPHGVFPFVGFWWHWLLGSVGGIIVALTDLTARQGCT